MQGQSEEVRQRARNRRLINRRLGQEFARFEGGNGGIEVLAQSVTNDNLVLTDRLRAIETALRRGLITEEELTDPADMPTPADFGLLAATPEPKWDDWDIIGLIYGLLAFFIFFSLWVTIPNALFNNDIGRDARWLLVAIAVASIAFLIWGQTVLRILFNGLSPTYSARRRYRDAKLRYDLLVACRIVRACEDDVQAFLSASGPEFERLVARAFRRHGYRVEEVGGSNDGGIDLLVWKGSLHGIIQCKAHAKALGPACVRELLGALNHKGASVAYLATLNGVTESAREWCKGKPIVILEADHIIQGRF